MFLLLAALLATLFLAAACGDDDDDDDDSGTTTPTATEEASPSATETAASSDGGTIEVTDLLGRTVEVPLNPQAVVALSPTAIEYVYAVGGSVIGRNSSADYPAGVEEATDVGLAYTPSVEVILSLQPDLIVADSSIHAQPQLREQLEALDAPVIFAGAESYEQVLAGVRLLGEIYEAGDAAEALIADIEQARSESESAIADSGATAVVMIADRDQTLYAANSRGYVGDILTQVGLTNLAADQPDGGPFPGYSTMPAEQLLAFDPVFVLTITPAPEPAPRLSTLVGQIPPFQGLSAVQSGNVVEIDEQIFLQAPGPRVAEAFRILAETVTGGS